MVQLVVHHTDPKRHNTQRYRRTDRQTDRQTTSWIDANSRS